MCAQKPRLKPKPSLSPAGLTTIGLALSQMSYHADGLSYKAPYDGIRLPYKRHALLTLGLGYKVPYDGIRLPCNRHA